jgi:DNA-directed RNA polymerase specialized sigma24 family protein
VTMDEEAWMPQRFEEHRGRLKPIASRMFGSSADADDAVQEAWLRFARARESGAGSTPLRFALAATAGSAPSATPPCI